MCEQKRWTIWNPMLLDTKTVDKRGLRAFTDDSFVREHMKIGEEKEFTYGVTVKRIK